MCCKHTIRKGYKKFLPQGITRVFTKREETFPGKFFSTFSGKMSRHFFSEKFSYKSCIWKHYETNLMKVWFTGCNQLYVYKLLVMLWWNFVEKISRRENFGKSGKLPDGKISPRNFPRDFRVFSGNRFVNQGEKVGLRTFPGNFFTSFSDISGENVGKTFFVGVFSRKFPPKLLWVKLYKRLIYRLQSLIRV